MKMSKIILLVALLLTFGAFSTTSLGFFVSAEDGGSSEDDAHVEIEDEVIEEGQPEPGTAGGAGEDVVSTESEGVIGPASDVEINYILVGHSDEELPAGKIITCLISFRNEGEGKHNYKVGTIDASLRYPMDFSYNLQNYSAMLVNRSVDAKREATFSYVFKTSERYAGRPFGFVIEASYFDEDDTVYRQTVLNKTINFVEIDDVFDAEAIMLYVLFGAILVLIALIVYYYAFGGASKSSGKRVKSHLETGTAHKNGSIADEWLPEHARKSPKVVSPKSKKSKKDK